MGCDHAGHDDDERSGRAADLDARAAEPRNQETRDHRGDEALARAGSAGNSEGHRQRQRDNCDGETGNQVRAQLSRAISLAKGGDQLGCELLRKRHSA